MQMHAVAFLFEVRIRTKMTEPSAETSLHFCRFICINQRLVLTHNPLVPGSSPDKPTKFHASAAARIGLVFMPGASKPKAALEFKSASLTIPALVLGSNDLRTIEECLRERISRGAEFFRNSPLMIDLQWLNEQALSIDVKALVDLLGKLDLSPISLRGGDESQNKAALAMGISVRASSASSSSSASASEPGFDDVPSEAQKEGPGRILKKTKASKASIDEAGADKRSLNKYISQPIRSGQRVYSHGDLTITATVSAGAEIMAEGNIHVYGTLRGRALAGVLGDTSSRIFCMDLQAELLSIAGIYQLSDDIPREAQHKPAQISLDDQVIVIKAL